MASQCDFCTDETPFEPHMCDDSVMVDCDQCGCVIDVPRLSTANPDFKWWCEDCVGNEIAD